jgi:Arc/MetJ-type ribon-helix-helix transcriptional regulator
MKRHKTVCVTLSKERDGDILDWLNEADNKSEVIRAALRTARNAEKNNRGFYPFVTHTGNKRNEEEC